MPKPIVVGVDGSEPSFAALDWAVDEAVRRRSPLHIVEGRPGLLTDREVEIFAETAGVTLQEAAERASRRSPGIEVATEIAEDPAAAALVRRSGEAALVVVGSRGLGGFKGLLLGSVSIQVATHAVSPVVVVRAEPAVAMEAPEVLVGVDGSHAAEPALGFAFAEASLRGVRLRALRAWRYPVAAAPGDMLFPVYDPDVVQEEEELVVAEAIAGWRERYPDLEVVRQVEHGPPARALVAASTHANLVVLGSRGSGGFRDLLLGSVTHAVLHHAHCPVAVVH